MSNFNNTTTINYTSNPINITAFVIQSVLLVVGLSGNLLVIGAILSDRRLRSYLNYLVMNLSFCNICAVLFTIPFQLVMMVNGNSNKDFVYGVVECRVLYPTSTWAVNVSVSFLLTISVNRYIVIVHPFMWRAVRHHTLKVIIGNYLYGFLSVAPYALHNEVQTDPASGNTYCKETWSHTVSRFYTVLLFLLQYAVPLLAMVILYTLAWIKLKRTNDFTIQNSEAARTARANSFRRKQQGCDGTCNDAFNCSSCSDNNADNVPFRRRHESLASTYSDEARMMCLSFCCCPTIYSCVKLLCRKTAPFKENRKSQVSQNTENESWNNDADFFVTNGRIRQTIRNFFIFLLIITIFAISSLPHHLVWLLRMFWAPYLGGTGMEDGLPTWLSIVFTVLFYSNFVLNPFIYGGLNKYFLRAYKRLFMCVWCSSSSKERYGRDKYGNKGSFVSTTPSSSG